MNREGVREKEEEDEKKMTYLRNLSNGNRNFVLFGVEISLFIIRMCVWLWCVRIAECFTNKHEHEMYAQTDLTATNENNNNIKSTIKQSAEENDRKKKKKQQRSSAYTRQHHGIEVKQKSIKSTVEKCVQINRSVCVLSYVFRSTQK